MNVSDLFPYAPVQPWTPLYRHVWGVCIRVNARMDTHLTVCNALMLELIRP